MDRPTAAVKPGNTRNVAAIAAVFVALLAASTIAVADAPSAHADDQAFLADTAGVIMNPSARLAEAYRVCTDMRAGMPYRAALFDGFRDLNLIDGVNVAIVNAAQQDICPDTLGR